MLHTEQSVARAVAITGLAAFMAGLDNLVIVTALPTISVELGGALNDLEWTVNAYTLSFAVLMMLAAATGDRFGRRKVFVAGLLIFTVASAAAALAPGIGWLIAARAVQGVGAAVIMPLSLTLLTAAVPERKRGAALGIYAAVSGVSAAAGPLVGGLVVQELSWHWIFWLNVPVGLLLAPTAWWGLADSRGPNARLDVTGTVLVSLGMFGLVFGIVSGHVDGWSSPVTLTVLAGGVLGLILFVWWEKRTEEPMLPLALFRNRAFSGINVASLLMGVGVFGAIFLLTQFLQTVQGYDPMQAGVRMLAWTAAPMLAAPVSGMLADRFGGRPVVLVGLVLQTLALGYYAVVITPTVSYLVQLPAFVLAGIGMGLFYAPIMHVLMGSVREHEQGIASGANAATRQLGATIGVALLAAVFSGWGGLESPQRFVDGLEPALWVGAGALALAVVAMALVPRSQVVAQEVR
ncbi:DHA2 family efflux MFS transporter permease subunit [Lentzea kentuckyensis]|uniref:DHA2 family efflux MFS transporter permease subunit n=1 Tax=Lentzea kentuckyensis TaxID=360086 RepID=UPI000A367D9A|nr:DHA2 family efflux MFS transporter permease subunit [Lentzea kentuckyensis]